MQCLQKYSNNFKQSPQTSGCIFSPNSFYILKLYVWHLIFGLSNGKWKYCMVVRFRSMYHPCRGYKPAGFVIITQASCKINYSAVIQILCSHHPFFMSPKIPFSSLPPCMHTTYHAIDQRDPHFTLSKKHIIIINMYKMNKVTMSIQIWPNK